MTEERRWWATGGSRFQESLDNHSLQVLNPHDRELTRQAVELMAECLQGGPARRLAAAGRLGPKLGGPEQVATMFLPAANDPQVAAEFLTTHGEGMRAQVLNSALHAVAVWNEPGGDQVDFDARFVSLSHVGRFVHDRPDGRCVPIACRVRKYALWARDEMAAAWLEPMVTAKLNQPE
ncbi:hypothetical protein GCM10029964_013930 [Kibdelosporangium lantanae]